MPRRDENETKIDRLERWARNQTLLAIAMFIGIAIIGVSEVVDKGSRLLISAGLKREKTLALAEDSAKGQFSRELVEVAWRRMFWTRNYYRRVELRRSQQDIDDSWHKLMDSIADWSSRYMVFVNTVQQYYGDTDKGKQLQGIQEQFLALEERLVALRAAESGTDNRQLVQNIRETVDDLNTKLYFFVLNKNP